MGLFKSLFGSSSDEDMVDRKRKETFLKMAEKDEREQGDNPDTSLLYDVVLLDGNKRIYKVSRIIEKVKGVRYVEASDMVKHAPCMVAERLTYGEASSLCKELKNALAEVFMRRSEGQTEEAETEKVEFSEVASLDTAIDSEETFAQNDSVTETDEEVQDVQNMVEEESQKANALAQLITNIAACKQEKTVEKECKAEINEGVAQEGNRKNEVVESIQESDNSIQTSTVQISENAEDIAPTAEDESVSVDAIEENILDRGSQIASPNDECISIPEGITEIGQCCFSTIYRSLKKIVIPNTVTSIDELAFYNCCSLEEISIPDSVKTIGEGAFRGCNSLKSIKLSASLETIGKEAFADCSSLKEIVMSDAVQLLGDNAFEDCASLEKVRLSKQISSIGYRAFGDCSSLEEISLPDSVTTIGDYAFSGCEALENVILSQHLVSIGNCAFNSCGSLEEISLPAAVISIGEDAFYGCKALEEIKVPNSVTSIGEGAFRYCENLEEVAIGDSVTAIGNEVFMGCKCLETVKMPAELIKIGENVFSGKLSNLDFSKCSKLTKLNLNMFGNLATCELKCVYMPPSLEKLKGESRASITKFYLPPSFKKIPEAALPRCEQIYCYSERIESASALVTCCKHLFLLPDYIDTFVAYLQAEGKGVEQVGDKYEVEVSGVKFRHGLTVIAPIPPEQLYLYDD